MKKIILIGIILSSIIWGSVIVGLFYPKFFSKINSLNKEEKLIERRIDDLKEKEKDLKKTIETLQAEIENKEKTLNEVDLEKKISEEKIKVPDLKMDDFISIIELEPEIMVYDYVGINEIYNENGKLYNPNFKYTDIVRYETGLKLQEAHEKIKKEGYGLVLFQGYRSYNEQSALREHYKFLNGVNDSNYVASPGQSNHQKGIAVDVGLYDLETKELIELQTDYLELSKKANISYNDVSNERKERTEYLRKIMRSVGFLELVTEWWHFNDVDLLNKVSPVNYNIEEKIKNIYQ